VAAGYRQRYIALLPMKGLSFMKKEFINPPDLPNWEQSFSQIAVVQGLSLKTIYISGQVSVDQENNIVREGDLQGQADYAFANLHRALMAAGASPADVVKLNIYVVGYKPADAVLISAARRKVFRGKNLPASTLLGVESLALDGLLIEVEAVAVVEL
jgi:enamine deaminase RidA (YjgF/YER057c/UK114 family)